MIFHECFLHRVHFAVCGETFDGGHCAAIGLGCQNRAAFDRFAVEVHGAGAATRCVATNVGASQFGLFADVVHEQRARLNMVRLFRTVDGDGNFHEET